MTSQKEIAEAEAVAVLRSLIERLKDSQARIGEMCAEGRPPSMRIPADQNDDDIFICAAIKDAITFFQGVVDLTKTGAAALPPQNFGWRCLGCGRENAPFVQTCQCGPKVKITAGISSGDAGVLQGCNGRKNMPSVKPVAWIDGSGHPRHISYVQGVKERKLYGELLPLYDQEALKAAAGEAMNKCVEICRLWNTSSGEALAKEILDQFKEEKKHA